MGKVNLEKLKKKAKEVQERTEGGEFLAIKAGDTTIRIVPPIGNMGDDFFKEGTIHYNVGSDSKAVLCPAGTADANGDFGECPICELVDDLLKGGNAADIKLAKSIRAKSKFWINVIDVKDKARGVQVYGAPITVFKELLSYFTDPDYGDLTDPKEGRDVTITRSGAGIDTEYSVRPRPKTSLLKKSAYKNAHDLSTWEKLVPPTAEEIAELLGLIEDDDDEPKKKKKSKKAKEEEEEEEDVEEIDDDEDEEEDDEEEEEEEEEDDSDEEDDDEDEDEESDEEDDEDEEEDEDDEEDEEEDDEDDEDEDEDEDEEEEEPQPKRKSSSRKKKTSRSSKKSTSKSRKRRK